MLIYALPFIAALIGWVTNYLAVKMLFHPRKPINVLGVKVQGVFPKRQKHLAEKLGEVVSSELISTEEIARTLEDPANLEPVYQLVDQRIEDFLQNKLTQTMPMLALVMNDTLKDKIKTTLVEEINGMLPTAVASFASQVENKMDVKEMVKSKVEAFSMDKLEQVLFSIMKKEFKFIELVGAVLGFVIGLIQVALMYFN